MNHNLQRFITKRVKNTKFECINCGTCCKTAEIMLSNREIGGISHSIKMEKIDFINKYLKIKTIEKEKRIEDRLYKIEGEVYVIKKIIDGTCPFYEEIDKTSRCKIYEYRPIVCRLFPFTWEYFSDQNSVNIDFSENGWNECPGIKQEEPSNWDEIREQITGAVILSIIQSAIGNANAGD